MAEPTIRELKLIQYLNEAYGKERELETALQAHIKMTTRDAYKKRLQAHLKETKGHAREVKARIKKLGGEASEIDIPGPEVVKEVATGAQAVASKALALAQGPLHALRGTSVAEKQLKNAKTEYANEAEEIAMYTAIESLADALSDDDTVKLARRIRRDEQRMGTYLEKLIPSLTKAVVQEEIPAAERRPANGRRAASSARSNGGRSRSGTSRAAGGTSRSASRSAAARAARRAARAARPAAQAARAPPRGQGPSARSRTVYQGTPPALMSVGHAGSSGSPATEGAHACRQRYSPD